jgi:hypothetical protein
MAFSPQQELSLGKLGSLSTGHSSAGSGTDGIFAYHNSGGSKELDGCRMARNRSESSIPCN